MFSRSCGILMPISSIPSKYGIGTFGKEAYNYIDFLKKTGQKYWQILPMGHVSYGDSPYSSFSIYAGNPYYIDLEMLIEENIITKEDCDSLNNEDDTLFVNYEIQFNYRYTVLSKAYQNAKEKYKARIAKFKKTNNWVLDYALFMALKYKNNQKPWYEWEKEIIKRDPEVIKKVQKELKEEINYWCFIQYLFYKQYTSLKSYANKNGIQIIGDIPIYVAFDSVDVWAYGDVFLLDNEKLPKLISGVPPDAFSDEGQLWGNPVYNWNYLKKTSYEWWIDRINYSFSLYDVTRIDHFRGFDEFWAVPYGSKNAIDGKWYKAYGEELFKKIKNEGDINVIAEDLGVITESVKKLMNKTGFPGIKVLHFAFDGSVDNPYLPKNFTKNSVCYTGTHDNDTLKGWFKELSRESQKYVLETLNIDIEKLYVDRNINEIDKYSDYFIEELSENNNLYYEIVEALLCSNSDLCIIPMQDYLCLGKEARMNKPSTIGNNWRWRLKKEYLNEKLFQKINDMVIRNNR